MQQEIINIPWCRSFSCFRFNYFSHINNTANKIYIIGIIFLYPFFRSIRSLDSLSRSGLSPAIKNQKLIWAMKVKVSLSSKVRSISLYICFNPPNITAICRILHTHPAGVPWQTNNTFIGISYLQNRIKLLQFAPVCQAA